MATLGGPRKKIGKWSSPQRVIGKIVDVPEFSGFPCFYFRVDFLPKSNAEGILETMGSILVEYEPNCSGLDSDHFSYLAPGLVILGSPGLVILGSNQVAVWLLYSGPDTVARHRAPKGEEGPISPRKD